MMHRFTHRLRHRTTRDALALDNYWTALRGAAITRPPAELSDGVADVAERLSARIPNFDASDAFVARLRSRLDEAHQAQTARSDTQQWAGPVIGPNSRRRAPVRETKEQQIMSPATDQPTLPDKRSWSKELWKVAATMVVFAVVGALLVLLLRNPGDEPAVVQPGPTATPTAGNPTPTANIATIEPTITAPAAPSATVTAVPTTTPGAVAATSPASPPPTPAGPVIGEVVATVPAGAGPEAMAASAGAVWVANELDGTVTRIDPATNKVVATIQVGTAGRIGVASPLSLAASDDSLWVLVNTDAVIVRIDATTNAVAATIALPNDALPDIANRFRDLAAGPDALWVTDSVAQQVLRIDPASLAIVATIDGVNAYGLLVTDAAVWAAEYATPANTVYRIDPTTNTVTATITVPSGPIQLAAGFDSIWVTSLQAAALTRIDPATNEVIATISLQRVNPAAPFPTVRDLAVDEHGIWVGDVTDGGLYLIDPETNEAVGMLQTGPVGAVVVADGSLWISDWDQSAALRIDPSSSQ